jgi:hypothetical protein
MPTISNLPSLSTVTAALIMPVVDVDGTTKKTTISQLSSYLGTGGGGAGYTGSTGSAGSNGYTGSRGATGVGNIGYTGSVGGNGSNGYTGSAGVGYTGSSGAASGPYDVHIWYPYRVSADQQLMYMVFPRPVELTGDGYAFANTPPTLDFTFDVLQSGYSIGSISFLAEASVGTVAVNTTTFVEGDILSIVAPSPSDVTLAGIMITLKGTR